MSVSFATGFDKLQKSFGPQLKESEMFHTVANCAAAAADDNNDDDDDDGDDDDSVGGGDRNDDDDVSNKRSPHSVPRLRSAELLRKQITSKIQRNCKTITRLGIRHTHVSLKQFSSCNARETSRISCYNKC